jgi:GNAT superfamily N-acetyltransferase
MVRKAIPEDIDRIKQIADKNKKYVGFIIRGALVKAIQRKEVIVIEVENEIVGFVNYHHRRDDQTTQYDICIDEKHRGKGIGRLLENAALDEAKQFGKKRYIIRAPIDLESNIFYERIGFKLKEVEKGRKRPINVWEYTFNEVL